jgi:hypothetical protein
MIFNKFHFFLKEMIQNEKSQTSNFQLFNYFYFDI